MSSSREGNVKMKIMILVDNEKRMRDLAMLRYQAARYKSVGNGSMSQQLNAEIRRIMALKSQAPKN
jgi:hypothetical protein